MSKLTIVQFCKLVKKEAELEFNGEEIEKVTSSFDFLKDYSSDKIIYGINTGFGPMAQFKINDDDLDKLQYNLIRSHSTGTGQVLDAESARAVMISRYNSLVKAKSGISPGVMSVLKSFINSDIVPEIFEHGGVGASGDLVQLSQLALNLIGEGYVYVNGKRVETSVAFANAGIEPAELELRDGLGLINGTSCMTGVGILNLQNSQNLLNWSIFCSSCINELVESFDDSMSEQLNSAKCHEGQKYIAAQMRHLLSDSGRMKNRVIHFKGGDGKEGVFKKKVQEYYSIRCVPQILGPIYDTIQYSKDVLENELNSTNDNPIVDIASSEVYHGGNFHGDYISLEMDKIKIVVTKMMMLCERQLNFLLNPSLNQKFPPFLNTDSIGLNFGMQGAQFTATSTVAECQTLSFPNYVHSIPNNNDNQDIVSMGMNSASITKRVIDNAYQIMSVHLLSLFKAYTLLDEEGRSSMSSKSKKVFEDMGKLVEFMPGDRTLNEELANIESFIRKSK